MRNALFYPVKTLSCPPPPPILEIAQSILSILFLFNNRDVRFFFVTYFQEKNCKLFFNIASKLNPYVQCLRLCYEAGLFFIIFQGYTFKKVGKFAKDRVQSTRYGMSTNLRISFYKRKRLQYFKYSSSHRIPTRFTSMAHKRFTKKLHLWPICVLRY